MGFLERKENRRKFLLATTTILGGLVLACREKSKDTNQTPNGDNQSFPPESTTPKKPIWESKPFLDEQEYHRYYDRFCSEKNRGKKFAEFEAVDLYQKPHNLTEIESDFTFLAVAAPDKSTGIMLVNFKAVQQEYGTKVKTLIVACDYTNTANLDTFREEIEKGDYNVDVWLTPFSNLQSYLEESNAHLLSIPSDLQFPMNYLLDRDKKIILQCIGWGSNKDFWLELLRQNTE